MAYAFDSDSSVYTMSAVDSSSEWSSDSEGIFSRPDRLRVENEDLDDQGLDEELARRSEPLQRLYAAQNRLAELPPALSSFRDLRVLDLSHNHLNSLDNAVLQLRKLEVLLLRHNQLRDDSLPKDFGLMSNLRELNLSGNSFSHIPDQVFELRSLADLKIAENQIQTIPDSIHHLHRLRVLHVGGNQLSRVPEVLGSLLSLQVLVLCDNQLTELPASICRLTRLHTLLLHANQLSTLPGAIVRLRALRSLSLRDNPLVRNFVSAMEYEVPSLVELAARTVKLHHVSYTPAELPRCLIDYLAAAKRCVNKRCKGVFFDTRVEAVAFVDFCGMFHIPLMRYLCSSHCESEAAAEERARKPDSDSDTDVEVERRRRRLRRVLLG